MVPYKIVIFIFIALVGAALINLLRKQKIKEQYVWLWLFLDVLALIATLLPQKTLDAIARIFGFEISSNMILVSVMAVLVFMSIYFGIVASGLYEDRRKLTEEVALLKLKTDKLETSLEEIRTGLK
ncbi:DUF2304 domain-containing protein [uncultured Arcanobacterium sp.]|uniref:DUF2304 domain-containing protein n=1 Tax=uncultured Arcanobacterium sp. TaxID=487520 RepID=UPI0026249D2D|nr:DUF2304 domain-containing protein [uncultured Arcanobacterium sp.]